MTLEASPHCCQEASPLSRDAYIPCNAPARRFVFHERDRRVYRMCEACADHNFTNRGALDVGEYPCASDAIAESEAAARNTIEREQSARQAITGRAKREAATIIAALRYFNKALGSITHPPDFEQYRRIACGFGKLPALSRGEIARLCEAINAERF